MRNRNLFFGAMFIAISISSSTLAADEFSFEMEEIEKKAFEIGGYLEMKWEHIDVNQPGALNILSHYDDPVSTIDRFAGSLQLDGSYLKGIASVNWLLKAAGWWQENQWYDTADVYEGYVSLKPTPSLNAALGKQAYKWGKGYAWNPVGFINRPKDPNNPEEALEGYITAEAEYIKSYSGRLQNIALTTVLLPVSDSLNDEFGKKGNLNAAAKLYLLFMDTDIDFLVLTGNSRSSRFGLDFSRNITPNFEIHGEYAFLPNLEKVYVDQEGGAAKRKETSHSLLLGIRYLSDFNLTSIIEYYHNGAGYSQDELDSFYQLVADGEQQFTMQGDTNLLQQAGNLGRQGYSRPNPGTDYLYGRFTLKEPWDILYFTPALTAIFNLADQSYSITPELLYTGFTNWEIRLRCSLLGGGFGTEFGEKQNENKVEMRLRYFF